MDVRTECKGWELKNWCFRIVVLEKTLESPLDNKEIKPVNPKRNQPWIFIGKSYAEAEAPILWPPDDKSSLIGKDPDAVAKILGPCPPMPNWNMETEFGGNRKEKLYYFYQAKGKHLRLTPQELCPPFSGKGRGFISSWRSGLIFSPAKFLNGHSWHQATQQLGLVSPRLLAHDLLSKMQNATRECGGKSMPGAEYNLYGVRE